MSSPSKSPCKGIQFFYHFLKNFWKPYGKAGHAPHMNAIFNRLKLFNCEWLIHPKVALSELMATMMGNLNVLAEIPQLVNSETVHDMAAPMSSILTTMAKFDTPHTPPKKRRNSQQKGFKAIAEILCVQR